MKNVNDIIGKLPAYRRAKINARANELIAEEMTLRDVRKARALTQERMAELLSIGQDSVSRLEKRSDLLLSTLRSYLAAMDADLELVVRFKDRAPVVLTSLEGMGPQPAPKKAPARRKPELVHAR